MKVQALSVISPWGRRIAEGAKRIEVRRWRPKHLPIENVLIVENDRRLKKPNEIDPDGRALALVTIRDISDWTPDLAEAACAEWQSGWLAWTLSDIRRIHAPFRAIAARKLYEIEIDDAVVTAGSASFRYPDE